MLAGAPWNGCDWGSPGAYGFLEAKGSLPLVSFGKILYGVVVWYVSNGPCLVSTVI